MTSSPDAVALVTPERPALSAGRAAVLATVMTAASYAATLVMYVVYARSLGVGREADALAIAIAWATSVAGVITTTLTGVALPPFVRDHLVDPHRARSGFRTATAVALGASVAVGVFTVAGADSLSTVLAPSSDLRPALVSIAPLTALLTIAWTVVGTLVALANATEHYGPAAASGVVPSVVVIGALLVSGKPTPEFAMSAYLLGACGQIAWLAVLVRNDLGVLMPIAVRAHVVDTLRRSLPVVLTLVLFNGAVLLARSFAATGATGDVAVFDYAARLVLAGQQVLLAGVLAVALTKWSQRAVDGASNPAIGRTIAVALGLVIPAATALALLAPEIVASLLTGGRFSTSDAARVAEVLRWMAPGVAAQMVLLLGFRALTAYQRLWPMAGIGAAHVGALLLAAWIAQPRLGVSGVGLAYSISWVVGLAVTMLALAPLIEPGAQIPRQVVATTVSTLVAALATASALAFSADGVVLRFVVGVTTFGIVGWIVGYVAGVEFVRSATRQVRVLRPIRA